MEQIRWRIRRLPVLSDSESGKTHYTYGSAETHISAPITDARKNLIDSIRFAVKEGVKGVHIVFDGKSDFRNPGKKGENEELQRF